MSRGAAVITLTAAFAGGGLAGWVLRGVGPRGPAPVGDVGVPAGTPPSPPLSRTATPPRSSTAARAAAPAGDVDVTTVPTPGRWYRLTKSDTFSEVARRAYGSLKRLAALEAANPGLDPQRLRAGMLVYVPGASETAPPAPPPAPASSSDSSKKTSPPPAPAARTSPPARVPSAK